MDIKIIATSTPHTGGDCITHYKAKFEENPTLGEFVEWIFAQRSNEWGDIYVNTGYSRKKVLEYKYGAIVSEEPEYYNNTDKTIELLSYHGGWSAADYEIRFIEY